MNSKKILLFLFAILLTQGCNDPEHSDNSQTSSPLECLSFYDSTFGIYAMTHWDVDHNGCLTVSEAQSVQALPDNAFAGNTALQSLNDLNSFPNLTVIGNNAFAGCTSLVSANLPNIKTVGNNAFSGCTNLVSVQLPNAGSISDNAFEGCTNLTNIVGPVTQNTCTGSALKCSDDNAQVLICMNNQWMTKENCANGCSNGACISTQPPKTCTKGTLKCSDDNAQVLLCKNDKWIALASCANGCADGICISTTPTKTCTEGALKCSDDGKQAMICMNDQWVTKENCDNGCANGVCTSSEPDSGCIEGAQKCADDGITVQYCTFNHWFNQGKCIDGCANGICKDIYTESETCTYNVFTSRKPYCSEDKTRLLYCQEYNETVVHAYCDHGCEKTDCIIKPNHPCTEGTTRYNRYGDFFVCHDGAWIKDNKCEDFLDDGTCYAPEQSCDSSQHYITQCSDNIVLSCNIAESTNWAYYYRWMFSRNCGIYGCNSETNACNSLSTCPQNGALKCSDDNTHSLECINGNWYWLENCPNGCEDGICIGSEDYCALYASHPWSVSYQDVTHWWRSYEGDRYRLRCSSDHKYLYVCHGVTGDYEPNYYYTTWRKYACDYCVDGLCLCKNGVASKNGNCESEPQNDKCTPGETRTYCKSYHEEKDQYGYYHSWVVSYLYKQTCTENDDKTTSFTFDHGKDVIKQCRYGCNDELTDCLPEDNGYNRVRGCNGHDFGDILEYDERYDFQQTVWEIPSDKYELTYPFASARSLLAEDCSSYGGDPLDYCNIDWGDGYSSTVFTSGCQGATGNTHTYSKAGTYTITTNCPFDLEFYADCWIYSYCSHGYCPVECADYPFTTSLCDLIPELVEIKDWSK